MSVLIGLGMSAHAEVYAAGQDAARQMVFHLGGRPQLTLVFCAMRFADPKLLVGIRSVTEGAPLIGCTGTSGINTWGPTHQSVVVIGLRGANVEFVTGVANGISRDPEGAGQRLAQDLKAAEPGIIQAALMFPDGMAPNGSALLRGVQSGLGSTPIVGGSAADDFHFERTYQFYDDDVLNDSVPGALLCGDMAVGIGVRHGWVPLGRPRQITRSKKDVIYQIDGKPAVELYEKYLGTRKNAFRKHSLGTIALMYPLGVSASEKGEGLLRSATHVGDRGSLVCSGEFPEGSSIQLMIGGYESVLDAAGEAARQASNAIGQNRFKGALVFSSAGRQKMLGSECQGEIDVIRSSLGGIGVRLGGFYGYGELAPLAGNNLYHNESVVVMALG